MSKEKVLLKIKFLIIKSVGVRYFKEQFVYVYFYITDLVLIASVYRKVINNMNYYVIFYKLS